MATQFISSFMHTPTLSRVAAGLLSALRPPNTITATPETVEVVKLILSYITNTVVAQRLLYSSLLGNTVLDIYGAIFESSPFRYLVHTVHTQYGSHCNL